MSSHFSGSLMVTEPSKHSKRAQILGQMCVCAFLNSWVVSPGDAEGGKALSFGITLSVAGAWGWHRHRHSLELSWQEREECRNEFLHLLAASFCHWPAVCLRLSCQAVAARGAVVWCGGDLLQGGVALATAAIEKTDQRCHVYWNCRSLHYCMMFLLAGGSRSVSECCSSQAGQDVNPAQSLKHPPNWPSFQSWIFHWWHRLCLCVCVWGGVCVGGGGGGGGSCVEHT